MKAKKSSTLIGVLIFIICASTVTAMILLTINQSKQPSITAEQAEQIAINQAIDEGYEDVTLSDEYSRDMYDSRVFSEQEEKDVQTWEIRLNAKQMNPEYNTPAVIYYIHQETGDIIRTIYGIELNSE
ncbi:hypothetical protein [Bacillus solimangrovi]|uniref:PepSY domain-containing protein n=1 Tax=Bacillus solimangrovi TaxID=1305675 RepID=A0A1E5LDD1_9BACI|nr:hypothetical protein [Bacillus solimangrovi]OEH92070.1 hypothetical protein BFG57_17010 [Bacillus solimangrovi]